MLLGRTELSRSTLYRMIAFGILLRQLRLGVQATGWYRSQVAEWIAEYCRGGFSEEVSR